MKNYVRKQPNSKKVLTFLLALLIIYFAYLIFKKVPELPATVVGSLPSHACALRYSIYNGLKRSCLILIANAAAFALITVSAESALATATLRLPSAIAAIACCSDASAC